MIKEEVQEAFKMKYFTREESNSHLLLLMLATMSAGRGLSFLSLETIQIYDTWYMELHSIVDLRILGTALIILSVNLIVNAFRKSNVSSNLIIASNFLIGLIFILIAAAAMEFSEFYWAWLSNSTLAVFHIITAGTGVYWAWIKKCKKKTDM